MNLKMNSLLARLEHVSSVFNQMLVDYVDFFKKNQKYFLGTKKTHVPRDGYIEDSSKIANTKVVTTVSEKLLWFSDQFYKYLTDLFSVEATNSKGAYKVELIVEGQSFGFLTALDLMRLKNVLTNKNLEAMYQNIPIRSDSVIWEKTDASEYVNRDIYQTPRITGVTRTTESEEVILKDPNLDSAKLPSNYSAKTTIKKKTVETGDYTIQDFSGEYTHEEKAELLRRKSLVLEAVIEALKTVNDVEVETPNLNVNNLIQYINNQ